MHGSFSLFSLLFFFPSTSFFGGFDPIALFSLFLSLPPPKAVFFGARLEVALACNILRVVVWRGRAG